MANAVLDSNFHPVEFTDETKVQLNIESDTQNRFSQRIYKPKYSPDISANHSYSNSYQQQGLSIQGHNSSNSNPDMDANNNLYNLNSIGLSNISNMQTHEEEYNRLNRELDEENFEIKKKLEILDLEEEINHANKLYDPTVRIAHTIPSISDTQTMFSFRQNIIPSETTVMDNERDFDYSMKFGGQKRPSQNGVSNYYSSPPLRNSAFRSRDSADHLHNQPDIYSPQTTFYSNNNTLLAKKRQDQPLQAAEVISDTIKRTPQILNSVRSQNNMAFGCNSANDLLAQDLGHLENLIPESSMSHQNIMSSNAPFFNSTMTGSRDKIQQNTSFSSIRDNNAHNISYTNLDNTIQITDFMLSEAGQNDILEHGKININNLSRLLDHNTPGVRKRAAAYLAKIAFSKNDSSFKYDRNMVQTLVPKLIQCLADPVCRLEAIGALTNLSHQNLQNKLIIRDCNGITEITRCVVSIHSDHESNVTNIPNTNSQATLTSAATNSGILFKTPTPPSQLQTQTTAIFDKCAPVCNLLWNLSDSFQEFGQQVVRITIPNLYRYIMVPFIKIFSDDKLSFPQASESSMICVTATLGIMKNVSGINSARRYLRDTPKLVDDLLWILTDSLKRSDVNGKLVENSACIIRNLVYNLHLEVPNADKYYLNNFRINDNSVLNTTKDSQKSESKVKSYLCFAGNVEKMVSGQDDMDDAISIPELSEESTGWELLEGGVKHRMSLEDFHSHH